MYINTPGTNKIEIKLTKNHMINEIILKNEVCIRGQSAILDVPPPLPLLPLLVKELAVNENYIFHLQLRMSLP